jgi:hypothetical protein
MIDFFQVMPGLQIIYICKIMLRLFGQELIVLTFARIIIKFKKFK